MKKLQDRLPDLLFRVYKLSRLRKNDFPNQNLPLLQWVHFYEMKEMCSFQTLFNQDSTGYVVRCRECEKIQLAFGNMVLTLSDQEFDFLRGLVKLLLDEQPAVQMPSLRCVVVPTPSEGANLLLSPKELMLLDRMLEDADTELKSSRLINLFHQQP